MLVSRLGTTHELQSETSQALEAMSLDEKTQNQLKQIETGQDLGLVRRDVSQWSLLLSLFFLTTACSC